MNRRLILVNVIRQPLLGRSMSGTLQLHPTTRVRYQSTRNPLPRRERRLAPLRSIPIGVRI